MTLSVLGHLTSAPASPPGDADSTIDLADHAEFHDCMTGPQGVHLRRACDVFAFEPDGDIDLLRAFRCRGRDPMRDDARVVAQVIK